jgi:hypothetical protein
VHARTERRFEDCHSQWAFTLLDSPIGQDDNPFPVSRTHVPRQRFELVKPMLLGHDLSEQCQRLFGLVVQIVVLEFLSLLLQIVDTQIALCGG